MATYYNCTYFLPLVQPLEGCLPACSSHRYVCVGVQGVCCCFQWSARMCQLVEHRWAPSCNYLLFSSAGKIVDPGSEEEAEEKVWAGRISQLVDKQQPVAPPVSQRRFAGSLFSHADALSTSTKYLNMSLSAPARLPVGAAHARWGGGQKMCFVMTVSEVGFLFFLFWCCSFVPPNPHLFLNEIIQPMSVCQVQIPNWA